MEKIRINVGTIADEKPNQISTDKYGHIQICMNIEKKILPEIKENGIQVNRTVFEFDSYFFDNRQISSDDIIDSLIRQKYGISEEFAIIRQRDTNASEFSEYFNYCENCKVIGKTLFNLLNDIE